MGYPDQTAQDLGQDLKDMSARIDDEPTNRANTDLENFLLRTVVKLSEELGELSGAIIGVTGQNPRKGVTHTYDDVDKELLDIATTALGAFEYRHGNSGVAVRALSVHVAEVRRRQVYHDQQTKRQNNPANIPRRVY